MDKFQPKDPSKDGHKKDHNSDQNKSHGLQPRQMSRRMGRSMNRLGSVPETEDSKSSGLDSTVQAKMENAFDEDFSNVEITQNSKEATNMGALAFTQGDGIYFAPGEYKPKTTQGQELIGHELAHVVQQKKARAIGTKQAKGSAINEDSALEKEADEMGKKAAGGEKAVVEKKTEQTDSKKEPKPDHSYMKVLGWGRSADWTIFGTSHTTRFIYSGEATDWKKLLATLDSDRSVIKYLSPFLAALGCGSGNVKYNPYDGDYTEGYEYQEATPGDHDILNLLKALYDTEDGTSKNSLDLPNEFWTEGGSNIPRYYDMGFDGLAKFISKYQTLLISEKSAGMPNKKGERTEEVAIQYDDVKKLATEGTRWSDPQINNPRVVQAMIDNAFATAVAATKRILANQTENTDNKVSKNKEDRHASMIITNSAIVISAAIDSYSATVLNTNKAIESVFNQAWDIITIPKALPSLLVDEVKSQLSEGFKRNFVNGQSFTDTQSLKHEYQAKFMNILSYLSNVDGVDYSLFSDLKSDFIIK